MKPRNWHRALFPALDALRALRRRAKRASGTDSRRTVLQLVALEERLVPDGRPLPLPIIYAGSGVGEAPLVRSYDAETGAERFSVSPFSASYRGGVTVGTADLNLDGIPEVFAAPASAGTAPVVKVYDGRTGAQLAGPLGELRPFERLRMGGLSVAGADIDRDGRPDIITAAVAPDGARVRAFSGKDGTVIADFAVTGWKFGAGLTVAAADLTGDGRAEVLVGAAVGGVARVYDPRTGQMLTGPLGEFKPFGASYTGGVNVGADSLAGDVDGDGVNDIAVGTGAGALSRVRVLSGATGAVLHDLTPFGAGAWGGARVGLAYVDDDARADVVVGRALGGSEVRIFHGVTGRQLLVPVPEYRPFGDSLGGVFVASTNDPVNPALSVAPSGTVVVGQTATATATIIGTNPPGAPTGTVTFSATPMSGGAAVTLGTVSATATGTGFSSTASLSFNSLRAGTYSLKAQYNGDANYNAISSTNMFVVNALASTAPAALASGGGASGYELVSDPAGAAQARGGHTVTGVNVANGTLSVDRTDLMSEGLGDAWGVNWSWTSGANYGDGTSGGGATSAQTAHLVQVSNTDVLALVTSAGNAIHFDKVSGAYVARYGHTATLVANTGSAEFAVTDGTGRVLTFYDFTNGTTGLRGKLKSVTDTDGQVTSVTSWSGSNATEVQRVTGSGSSARTESFVYAYVASGTNAGKLESVLQRVKIGTGSWSTVRSVEYTYHDGTTSVGKAGELRTAVVKDASGTAIDTSYYRYYTTGSNSRLKYAFGSDAYGRLVGALGSSVDALTDAQVDDYADKYVEYDATTGKVTKVVDAQAGSTSTGGLGEFTYTYSTNSANGPLDASTWTTKTVETRPDGSTNTIYANGFGQVMLSALSDGTSTWRAYAQFDSAGRVTLTAGASTVTGLSESNADLVGFSGGNASYLSDSAGLVTAYTYGSSTTATSSTAGDALGYIKSVSIQQGETGTAVPQSAFDYIKRTPGSTDFFFTADATQYRNDNGTGAQTTSYTYTWKSGTAQAESVTTTLPTVTTAQNGPNSATSATTVYDTFGRPVWMKDAGGFIRYVEYDTLTGAILKDIVDVDTTQTTTFSNLPSGWSTPSGGGLHLTTTYEVDSLGRATKVTHPNGRVDYTVYKDADLEVRRYSGWDSTNNVATGPTVVTREDRANNYTETLTMSATPSVTSGKPTGAESIGSLQSLTRSYRNAAGQNTYSDAYFDLSGLTYSTSTTLGTENTNFYRTEYQYDTTGAVKRSETPLGTITRTVRDGIGRAVSEWVGTDDTPTSGNWSPSNTAGTNLVKVREFEYDGGGVGDGNVTKVTEYPGNSASARVTQTWFDWRNRAVAVKSGVEATESTSVNRPLAYYDFDNLNNVVKVRSYDADTVTPSVTSGVPQPLSASLLRAQTTTSYDELGRAYLSETYSVDPSSGNVGANTLKSQSWFDARGLVVKTSAPGGVVQKSAFDGAGRLTTSYMTDGGGDSAYADAANVTGDIVLEQAEYAYDASGNALTVTSRQRFHDASGTGALGSPASGIGARVSYSGFYYDLADRQTATVDVGTNGASAWTRPGSVPSRSSTVLVNSVTFDAAGRVYEVTDAAGRVTRTTYDALGRTTKTVENYVDGTVSDGDDKTTEFTYNAAGMTSLTARLTGGGVQTTEWVFGVTQGSGSAIDSNDVVGATRWPDPTSGAASSGQQETTTVNALGQTLTTTDRNGSTHTLSYDVLGRVVSDAVTTLGSGVDGGVRRIETAYDGQGNAYLVTSYNAASGGSVVNQVQRTFNGLGQLVTEYQEHGGAVNTSTSPKVQYAWSEMASGANHSRLTSVTYANGYVLTYNYASGLNSDISRLTSLSDANGTLESFDHLGLGTVVTRAHSQPGVDLTYVKRSGESNADAGDQYIGLDRFGRVADHRWVLTSNGTARERIQYGYDAMGNRLYRDNLVNTAFGELYAYDGLNQLTSFDRGTLNGTKTGLTGAASATQTLDFDAVGNWESVTTNGTTQTRGHNKQNEITSVSGATTPTFDANGNMTGDETGRQFVYDAWNRMVTVKNSGGTTLKTYAYDGLNRRASETASGTTRDLYYSAQWKVLEERVSGTTERRYVWSPVYVDALVLRDRDTNADGSLDERLYVVQDANFNVTALVDTSGTVVERYTYSPFGVQTVYDASWTVRGGGSSYSFTHGFQGMRYESTSAVYVSRERPGYSPTLGRAVTVDPIHFKSRDVNFYRWTFNSPTNMTDPSGLAPPLMPIPTPPGDVIPVGAQPVKLNPALSAFLGTPVPDKTPTGTIAGVPYAVYPQKYQPPFIVMPSGITTVQPTQTPTRPEQSAPDLSGSFIQESNGQLPASAFPPPIAFGMGFAPTGNFPPLPGTGFSGGFVGGASATGGLEVSGGGITAPTTGASSGNPQTILLPAMDQNGRPIRDQNGRPVLVSLYLIPVPGSNSTTAFGAPVIAPHGAERIRPGGGFQLFWSPIGGLPFKDGETISREMAQELYKFFNSPKR